MSALTDTIEVPNAPPIPGLRFRGLRRPADFETLNALSNAARREAGIVEQGTSEQMANYYANLAGTDLERDVLVAEIDGRIVAYGRVEWFDTNAGERGYLSFCVVPREVRGRGIGSAMLDWQEARLRQIAAAQAPDRPTFLSMYVRGADTDHRALAEARGYAMVRVGHEMVRPNLESISAMPLPPGLEIRPASRDQARAIWEALSEAFRDHWGEHDESESGYRQFADDPRADPDLWVVAWDGDEIVGAVLNSVQDPNDDGRRLGYLDSVAVRRPWRRRGVARAMVAESLRRMRDRGATSAGLGVDAQNDNRALELYESAGFRVTATEYEYRRRLDS
jgi:ribosomal protein S18 acetylase RimI-like enzyme